MKKKAVTMLLWNDKGEILAVSRKNDPNDFGLPGGKIEEGETLEEAIQREVFEETGLNIYNLTKYFVRDDEEYECTTFIGDFSGEISSSEQGVVKWTSFEEIKKGTFGKYNSELEKFIDSKKL